MTGESKSFASLKSKAKTSENITVSETDWSRKWVPVAELEAFEKQLRQELKESENDQNLWWTKETEFIIKFLKRVLGDTATVE